MKPETMLKYSTQAEEYYNLLLSHYDPDELSELEITPDGQLEYSSAS